MMQADALAAIEQRKAIEARGIDDVIEDIFPAVRVEPSPDDVTKAIEARLDAKRAVITEKMDALPKGGRAYNHLRRKMAAITELMLELK